MHFLQTHIHRKEHLQLMATPGAGRQPSLASLDIHCPMCGLPYFSPVPVAVSRRALRWLHAEGKRYLLKECPDHPHRFTVEEW